MTGIQLHLARANLHAALCEESEALANARLAAETSGPGSAECAKALRAAEAAHARSNTAVGQVRALVTEAGRPEAAAPDPSPPPDPSGNPDF